MAKRTSRLLHKSAQEKSADLLRTFYATFFAGLV